MMTVIHAHLHQELTTEQLLDAALRLGLESGWEALNLADLAYVLQVPLTDIYNLVKQKDELTEALFDRADRNMLGMTSEENFTQLSKQLRLQTLITTWLDTLTPYRPVVREMLSYKLEPGHVHLQVLGIMRISRTVQWMLHAASIKDTGLRRITGEVLLTQLYLAVFTYWLLSAPDNTQLQSLLGKLLGRYC